MSKVFLAALWWWDSVSIFLEWDQAFIEIETIFQFPEIENEILYDTLRKLENDEWFYIEPDDKETMLWQYIHAIENTGSTNLIQLRDYLNISCLYLWEIVDSSEKILFSKIFPRQKIRSSNYIIFDGEPTLETKLNSVDVSWEIHAYWNGTKLYFRSYKTVMSLFPGISQYYVTATEEEKNNFLNSDLFKVSWNIKVWEKNMKKIAFIMREMNINFSDVNTRLIYKDYAIKYNQILNLSEDNKIIVKWNADLTKAIKIIQGCFWTSEITWEMMISEYSIKLQSL